MPGLMGLETKCNPSLQIIFFVIIYIFRGLDNYHQSQLIFSLYSFIYLLYIYLAATRVLEPSDWNDKKYNYKKEVFTKDFVKGIVLQDTE
jgi:hypothetical protein